MNKGFVMMPSYYEGIKELADGERLAIYDALCRFAFYGEDPKLEGAGKMVFCLIRPSIENALQNYEVYRRKEIKNGKSQSQESFRRVQRKKTCSEEGEEEEKGKTIDRDKEKEKETETEKETENEKREQSKKGAGEREGGEEGPDDPKPEDSRKPDNFERFAGSNEELLRALRDFENYCISEGRTVKDYWRADICRQLMAFPRSEWIPMLEQSVKNKMTYLYRLLKK